MLSDTVGTIHSWGFLLLLYILHHRHTKSTVPAWGMTSLTGIDAFTWRRSQFFWQREADMRLANAVALHSALTLRTPLTPVSAPPVSGALRGDSPLRSTPFSRNPRFSRNPLSFPLSPRFQ